VASLSDLKQSDWIKACEKLKLQVDKKSGRGSHAIIKHPTTNEKYTLQYGTYKLLNQKYYKKLQDWGFSDVDINKALGLPVSFTVPRASSAGS
jgi:predicted RNA binding protein YcfA (HicA-like mRNA interferase family)